MFSRAMVENGFSIEIHLKADKTHLLFVFLIQNPCTILSNIFFFNYFFPWKGTRRGRQKFNPGREMSEHGRGFLFLIKFFPLLVCVCAWVPSLCVLQPPPKPIRHGFHDLVISSTFLREWAFRLNQPLYSYANISGMNLSETIITTPLTFM